MLAKRIFDFSASLIGLIILSPFFIIIAFLIKSDSPGPVFFRQSRVGQFGQLFEIFKFRTMTVSDPSKYSQITIGADPRITRLGYFLRKYKIDELPQLIDVLLGRMSLVGPRPEVPIYVNYYPGDIKHTVLSVKPGITDKASIEFKAEADILEKSIDPQREYIEKILPIKLSHHLDYVRNRSLKGDFLIILKTIYSILT